MSLRRKTSIAAAAAACSLIASTSSAGIVVVSGFPTASSNSNRIRQQQQQHRHRLYSQHEGPNSGKNNEDGEASHPVSLFEDDTGTDNVKFGDSVPLKGSGSSFGESVPLKRPSPTNNMNNNNKKILVTDPANFLEAATATVDDATTNTPSALAEMKRRNLIVATCSIAFAISSYLWQFSHPITPVQLLADMQTNSAPLTSIGTNGKPTVVDFWAPWCENCKLVSSMVHYFGICLANYTHIHIYIRFYFRGCSVSNLVLIFNPNKLKVGPNATKIGRRIWLPGKLCYGQRRSSRGLAPD